MHRFSLVVIFNRDRYFLPGNFHIWNSAHEYAGVSCFCRMLQQELQTIFFEGVCLTLILWGEVLILIGLNSSVFWDITSCNPFKVSRRFGVTCRYLEGRRICQARHQREAGSKHSSASSETSIDFQLTIRRYIPKDRTLHNHRCENLKPHVICLVYF
jgi:hypothetical protein